MRRSEAQSIRSVRLDDPFINEDEELQDKAREKGKNRFDL